MTGKCIEDIWVTVDSEAPRRDVDHLPKPPWTATSRLSVL